MHQSDDDIMNLDNSADYDDMPYDPLEHRTTDGSFMGGDDLDQYLANEVSDALSEPAEEDGEDTVNADLWDVSPISGGSSTAQSKNKTRGKAGKQPRKKRAARPQSILMGFLALTTLCSLGLCLYMLFNTRTEPANSNAIIENDGDKPVFYSQDEVDVMMEEAALAHEQELKNEIMNQLSSENPSVQDTLRWLYSDFILYQDNGSYHFVPLSDTIERNTLGRGNLSVSENGEISYTSQNGTSARKGIDVSQHQGDIDWEQVAASGVELAMIRAGYRGYGTDGTLVTDACFERNMEGAAANGIDIGVYFFTQAITVEEALEEAQYVLELIAPYDIAYPIVIDVEKPSSSDARANALTQAQRTEIVSAFCDAIAEAGYTPMIYGGIYSLFGMLDINQVSHYKIWFAFYNDYIYYPYEMQMWQYTNKARIPGIEGDVDLDLWFLE